MILFFWIIISIILYSYLGYPVLLFILNQIKNIFSCNKSIDSEKFEPDVTLFISAHNEINIVSQKLSNSFLLDYPKNKITQLWITDGSDDGTPEFLKKQKDVIVYHETERKGKTGAINRGIQYVQTPIVIFSDANTILNKEAIREIVKLFKDPQVGCVAGEKRIIPEDSDNAVNAGEGIYWKYESFIKKNESDLSCAIGAVGELFAIRTDLFERIEPDTILDDFIISLRIALKGYKIKYTPKAFASERASVNIHEELKRKIRIAFGGFQSIGRLGSLLNIFKHPLLTFQYFSHKILRWFFVPISFILLFFTNAFILFNNPNHLLYVCFFALQLLFYLMVFVGYLLQSKKLRFKIIFMPFYLFIMNLSQIIGLIRFLRKKQSVNWERSKREQ